MSNVTTERAKLLRELSFGLTQSVTAKPDPLANDLRSIPVTKFDALSAIVELGYLDEKTLEEIGYGIATGSDLGRIGLLSDQLWGRFGVNSISPRILSFWAEACRVVGYPGDIQFQAGSLEATLAETFRPCNSASTYSPALPSDGPVCVANSELDPVVPSTLVHRVFDQIPGVMWESSPIRSHSSLDGVELCADRLRLGIPA